MGKNGTHSEVDPTPANVETASALRFAHIHATLRARAA